MAIWHSLHVELFERNLPTIGLRSSSQSALHDWAKRGTSDNNGDIFKDIVNLCRAALCTVDARFKRCVNLVICESSTLGAAYYRVFTQKWDSIQLLKFDSHCVILKLHVNIRRPGCQMHIDVYSIATNEYSRQKMSSNVGLLEPMC